MGIVRPVMEIFPYAWVFFIPFILIATFTMLNLFIAIIVNAMQTVTDADREATQASIEAAREHIETDLHDEVRALRGRSPNSRNCCASSLVPDAAGPTAGCRRTRAHRCGALRASSAAISSPSAGCRVPARGHPAGWR